MGFFVFVYLLLPLSCFVVKKKKKNEEMERDKQTILESIMLHMILFHLQIYICLQENDCFISILTYNV